MATQSLDAFLAEWHSDAPTILVHTSGSTGAPKAMRVAKSRMQASATMTLRFLGLRPGDTALLCMPLDYIAGKMMVVRSLVGGLRLVAVPPSSHPLASLVHSPLDFVAMVPMQVYNSLQVSQERELLRRVRHLIIGGGPVDDDLATQLRDFPNAVWSTYGMTETLSHIAMRRLNGPTASQAYTPLPGVSVSLSSRGTLVVNAPNLCDGLLETNDMAHINADGTFTILGRADNVIITGGIKVQIEAVEAALRPHITAPFLITSRPDPRLGEAIVLLTEGHTSPPLDALPRYWQPRHTLHVTAIPLTPTGKPDRAKAREMASTLSL